MWKEVQATIHSIDSLHRAISSRAAYGGKDCSGAEPVDDEVGERLKERLELLAATMVATPFAPDPPPQRPSPPPPAPPDRASGRGPQVATGSELATLQVLDERIAQVIDAMNRLRLDTHGVRRGAREASSVPER